MKNSTCFLPTPLMVIIFHESHSLRFNCCQNTYVSFCRVWTTHNQLLGFSVSNILKERLQHLGKERYLLCLSHRNFHGSLKKKTNVIHFLKYMTPTDMRTLYMKLYMLTLKQYLVIFFQKNFLCCIMSSVSCGRLLPLHRLLVFFLIVSQSYSPGPHM